MRRASGGLQPRHRGQAGDRGAQKRFYRRRDSHQQLLGQRCAVFGRPDRLQSYQMPPPVGLLLLQLPANVIRRSRQLWIKIKWDHPMRFVFYRVQLKLEQIYPLSSPLVGVEVVCLLFSKREYVGSAMLRC